MLLIWALAGILQTTQAAQQPAANAPEPAGKIVGWASLQYQRTNGRAGPGRDYDVVWEYHERGLPMAILRRSSEWTRVQDFDGDIVWMHNSVLRDRATALVTKGEPADLVAGSKRRERVLARVAPGVLVRVLGCDTDTCEVRVRDREGRIAKNRLWGNVSVKAK